MPSEEGATDTESAGNLSPASPVFFWLVASRKSWWSFTWNFYRYLIKLVVIVWCNMTFTPQDTDLWHIPSCCLLFRVFFKFKISPLTKRLFYYQLAHADCLKLPCGALRVQYKLWNGIWAGDGDMDRRCLPNIRWINPVNTGPDIGRIVPIVDIN